MNPSTHTTPAPEPEPVSASPPVLPARPDRGASSDARGDSAVPPLNRRQQKFCAHYALNGNAAEAARLAGYSERSAKNQGLRLLRDPRIRDRIYTARVNRAIQFGPVMAFARLEYLFHKASRAGDFRGAAHILTLQARLAGVESWMPPSAVVAAKQRDQLRLGRGVFGPKGRDPFDNLTEQCDIAYAGPDSAGAENDDQR